MELRDLEYFAVIAEQRHLGRAAEALKLTQPALSKSLRRLEAILEAKLVRRTAFGVELTAEGAALASRIQGLRLSLEDVAREVRNVTGGRVGSLRIGVAPGVPERLASAPCAHMLKNAPDIHVRVAIGHNNTLLPSLRNGELEVIVTGIPQRPYEDLVQEHLCDDRFIVFASETHPLAHRGKVDMSELIPYRWASATADVLAWQWLTRAFEHRGLPAPRSAMEAASYSLRALVTASSEILCFNSGQALSEAARDLPLVEIPVDGLKWVRRVGASYRKKAYLSPAGRRFIELLRAGAPVALTAPAAPPPRRSS